MKERIRAYMILNHIKPKQMAKCFGVSERTWKRWMSDPEHFMTAYRLNVIADVLHLTDEEFLEMTRRVA